MGIDYIIDYGCPVKESFKNEELLRRVKAGVRAQKIIDFYRHNGDRRPPEKMGFEMTRRAANGEEITETIQVKDLLTESSALKPFEKRCENCPANRLGQPFSCTGTINYPISEQAETWLLKQLPDPDSEVLIFNFLRVGKQAGYTGETMRQLRLLHEGVYFESKDSLARDFPGLPITSDFLFETFFLIGSIPPKRAVMFLLLMNGITREIEANAIMNLTPAAKDAEQKYPFLIRVENNDDSSLTELKNFLRALYIAYKLDKQILLDV